MKLLERSRYNFTVEKKIEFDNRNFWVLLGPDKRKYLLDCKDYSSYNIHLNDILDCRIDKVNCKGEVFLEPLHPYYREGAVYSFRVITLEDRIDKSGMKTRVVILGDNYQNKLIAPIEYFSDGIPGIGSDIDLKIGQIVKGIIHISGLSDSGQSEKSDEGRTSDFLIVGESTGVDGKVYLIIEDLKNVRYTIPKEYYLHYKFKEGDTFRGSFIKYKEGLGVNIEPVSPFFTPGNTYEFTVVDFIKISEGIDDVMVLEDKYGYSHQVSPNKDYKPGQKVIYRVIKMRKGWPLIEEL